VTGYVATVEAEDETVDPPVTVTIS
jgi:hypothetical protein